MIFFGDVHIGSRYSKIQELVKCLRATYVEEVVITGDLFENQYRRVSYDEAIKLIRRAMGILQIQPRRLYISFSKSSHDPQLPGPLITKIGDTEVLAYNGEVFIEGPQKIVVTHGDRAIRSGVLAYFIDLVRRGQLGRWLRRELALSDEVWLVYGHSHVPYVNEQEKILNPGSWKIYGVRRIRGNIYQLPYPKPLCQPDL